MQILAHHGGRILVLELEGPLFFGAAEKLAAYIENAMLDNVAYVVIDLNRVNEVDSTGAQIIVQLHDRITKQGRYLLMSSVSEDTRLARFLRDMGVTAALTRNRVFADLVRAIEWAEDHLILSEILARDYPSAAIKILANLGRELGARLRRANRTIQELAT